MRGHRGDSLGNALCRAGLGLVVAPTSASTTLEALEPICVSELAGRTPGVGSPLVAALVVPFPAALEPPCRLS